MPNDESWGVLPRGSCPRLAVTAARPCSWSVSGPRLMILTIVGSRLSDEPLDDVNGLTPESSIMRTSDSVTWACELIAVSASSSDGGHSYPTVMAGESPRSRKPEAFAFAGMFGGAVPG